MKTLSQGGWENLSLAHVAFTKPCALLQACRHTKEALCSNVHEDAVKADDYARALREPKCPSPL